jgi:hypothetical protein
MNYTFNIYERIWGRILYAYGMLWYIPFKILPLNMESKIFRFVLARFGYTRNPYYEITQNERNKK